MLYTYDASGTKLKSEAPDNLNTFYAGGFEYRADNALLRIGLQEGQLANEAGVYSVQYYLKDHLGNVRAVMEENGTIIQETEYYAFGLPIQRTGSDKNKYLYNGKEKQPQTEWLDYGARMYDPTIGRWMVVDLLSELYTQHSPYTYTLNNTLRFIDPSGMAIEDLGDKVRYTGNDMLALYNSLAGGGEDPKKKESRNPTVLLAAAEKGAEAASGSRLAMWGSRFLGAFGLLLTSHDAGVRNEWVMQLSQSEENRYQELLGKQSKATASGGQLTLIESRELYELENKKFPFGHSSISNKNVPWDARIAVDLAYYNKLADVFYDCSQLAQQFRSSFNGGYILEIKPKSGKWLNGIEYGSKTEFTYHQVYVNGKYVYDPMFSKTPIKTIDFIKAYQSLNPQGIILERQ